MNTSPTAEQYQAAYAKGLTLEQFHQLVFVHKKSIEEILKGY